MKRITFLFLIAIPILLNAQKGQPTFLGEDFEQYLGSTFTLNPERSGQMSWLLYWKHIEAAAVSSNAVAYPDKEKKYITVADSLMEKEYQVVEILGKDGNAFNKETAGYFDKPILVLEDTTRNETLYFKYKPNLSYDFPFLVSNLKLDKTQICGKISKRSDDFTDEVTYSSPIMDGISIAPMIVYKSISNEGTVYFLSLQANGSTLNVGESGVIILFEDGSKMTKSNKVDVDAGSNGYKYSAYITLSETEIEKLITTPIDKFRLYIYDRDVNHGQAEKLGIYLECMKEMN